jgi:Cu/Ag efflux protein CusF
MFMERLILTATLIAASASYAGAQTKTLPGEMKTATATVEAIDHGRREVTLKEENGEYTTITVPPENKKFDTIKVGDKVTARYYDNIVLRLKAPGEKDTDTDTAAVTGTTGARAGGTAATQRTITATITAIDMKVPSVTFSGPNNWKYSSKVEDKAALSKVKVGDKVDITWTEAVMISLDSPK